MLSSSLGTLITLFRDSNVTVATWLHTSPIVASNQSAPNVNMSLSLSVNSISLFGISNLVVNNLLILNLVLLKISVRYSTSFLNSSTIFFQAAVAYSFILLPKPSSSTLIASKLATGFCLIASVEIPRFSLGKPIALK